MLRKLEMLRLPEILVRMIPCWGVLLGILVAWLLFVSLRWGIVHDAPLMFYAGREVANGAWTGANLVEMNTPLVHWLHAAFYLLFGISDKAWRAFDLAVLAGIAVLGYRLIEPIIGRAALGAVLAVILLHLHGGETLIGQRDVMMIVPVLAACLLLSRPSRARGETATVAASGVLLAIAALLKPSALVYAPLVSAAVVATRRDLWRPYPLAAFAGPLAVGFLVPCVAVLLVLYLQGALGEFVTMWVKYLIPVYGKVRAPLGELIANVSDVALMVAFLAAVSIGLRARIKLDTRMCVLIAALGGGLASYFIQGKGWNYHTVPFHYTAILLAAVLATAVFQSGTFGRSLIALLIAFQALSLMKEVAMQSNQEAARLRTQQIPSPFARTLMTDLDRYVPRGIPVQAFDTTHGVIEAILRSERHQPTRFIYEFQFYLGGDTPYRSALRSEFLSALSAAGPHALVVTNQQWPDAAGFSRIDDAAEWPELHRRLATRYVLVATNGTGTGHDKQYRIYRSTP